MHVHGTVAINYKVDSSQLHKERGGKAKGAYEGGSWATRVDGVPKKYADSFRPVLLPTAPRMSPSTCSVRPLEMLKGRVRKT